MKKILFLISLLLCAIPASADKYLRAGASGSGNGSDWTNAYTTFAAAQTGTARGEVMWIASGSYGSITANKAASGSALMTVRAATALNHGTDTGWSSGFSGQAVFSHITVSTGYWLFDGQVRGTAGCRDTPAVCTPADWKTGYLIHVNSNGSECVDPQGTTHVTFTYWECQGANTTGVDDFGVQASGTPTFFTVDHCYIYNTGNSQIQMNNGASSDDEFSYCVFYHNHSANDGTHDEAFALPGIRISVHHNFFQDIVSTSVWSDASGVYQPERDWDFYGNIVWWDTAFGNNASNVLAGGVIHFNGTNPFQGLLRVYNNTVANIRRDSAEFVTWNNGSGTQSIQNNLSCNDNSAGTGTSGTQDYNAYYCGNSGASGPHDTSSASNPFQNSFGSTLGSNWDASLSVASEGSMSSGNTLAAPFNTSCDVSNGWCVNGVATLTRGANGKWDRGALQISSAVPAPAVTFTPTSLSFPDRAVGTTSPANASNISIQNTGSATLTISVAPNITGTNANNFAVAATTCGGTLAVSATCTVTVTFTPSTTGTRTAAMSISTNAVGSPQTVPLSGVGTTGQTTVPHAPIMIGAFPNGTVGTSYAAGLSVSGGSPPFSWSVNPNVPGLSLSATTGVLSGIPTIEGTYNLTFNLTDSFDCTGNPQCTNVAAPYSTSLVIAPAAATKPVITTQPQSQTTQAGGFLTFSVIATGTAPLSYQWMYNGSAIPGATSSTYRSDFDNGDKNAKISVTVTNSAGSVTSNAAIVTIGTPTPPPPVQSMTTTCSWLSGSGTKRTWRCDTVTSNIPSGQTIQSVVTSGSLTNTTNGVRP